jgi:hypothetical protein
VNIEIDIVKRLERAGRSVVGLADATKLNHGAALPSEGSERFRALRA